MIKDHFNLAYNKKELFYSQLKKNLNSLDQLKLYENYKEFQSIKKIPRLVRKHQITMNSK